MSDVEGLDYTAFLLVVIGALAWLYVGITNPAPDLLPLLPAIVERVVYILVGVAGVLDGLGVTGGYGILSDERSMM
jgi:uncharacterized membrane protein YuzA (DUF378 family)